MSECRLYSYEVSVKDTDWKQIINARCAGKAKYEYHRQILDAWPNIPYTEIRCRKIGSPHTSESFKHNALYRGFPNLKCGQKVIASGSRGVIVGHNSSANFNVLFNDDNPKYAGMTLNVHPESIILDNSN